MRGHFAKLNVILDSLRSKGQLPAGLRPCELQRRILAEAKELGYHPREWPSRTAIGRWLRKAGKMGNTDSVLSDAHR